MQLTFDAWLLMPNDVDMLGARDAFLAADKMRFGGANQRELWEVFARRGFGQFASSKDSADSDPMPSFASPLSRDEAQVAFRVVPVGGGKPIKAEVYVGDYQARVTPIADTDSTTHRTATALFMPGRYHLIVRADGYGAQRFDVLLRPNQRRTLTVSLPKNLASTHAGATGSGDGGHQERLLDDTEATDWEFEGRILGSHVDVDLAGGAHTIRSINVSALLFTGTGDGGRFAALRQFAVSTCDATKGSDCSKDAGYRRIYVSRPDAFPSALPRPLSPNLILRSFNVPDTRATHLRLVVLTNQCTGNRLYHGEQDNDPVNNTDCVANSPDHKFVRIAELQVFEGSPRLA
jgi:extracellular elastinolytic metalloproteinase